MFADRDGDALAYCNWKFKGESDVVEGDEISRARTVRSRSQRTSSRRS
jgi:hypothetical protein